MHTRCTLALIAALASTATAPHRAGAQAEAAAPTSLMVRIGDRVEWTMGGQLERGTVTGIYKKDASGAALSFYVTHDRTGRTNQYIQVWLNLPRVLPPDTPNTDVAPPMRPRAPCPDPTAPQGTRPTPAIMRALIQCHLEDNSGSRQAYTINVDITEFRVGRTLRSKDVPGSIRRYADPNAWVGNAFVRYTTRMYGSSEVSVFTGSEGPYMVYVDYNNRWVVGNGYIKQGQLTTLARPR